MFLTDWKPTIFGNLIFQFLFSFVAIFIGIHNSDLPSYLIFTPITQMLFALYCMKQYNASILYFDGLNTIIFSTGACVISLFSLIYFIHFSCLSHSSCVSENKVEFSALLCGLNLFLEVNCFFFSL